MDKEKSSKMMMVINLIDILILESRELKKLLPKLEIPAWNNKNLGLSSGITTDAKLQMSLCQNTMELSLRINSIPIHFN